MRPRALTLALAIALAVAPAASALTVRDLTGRDVTVAAPPRRIVSLVPSATEIVFALGAEDRLAGVTDFCDFPAAARTKPSVGSMINPSLETLVTLRPDLVIATREGNREETFTQLGRLGIPVFLVQADHVRDVVTVIERLADITDRPGAAAPLVRAIEERIAAVRNAVAGRPRPRVLYVVWPEPLLVPGRDAIVTELIQLAGGESITASDADAYPRFSLEAAIARHPELILLANHGAGATGPPREKWDRIAALVGRGARVATADGNLLHRYGPRIADGLEHLARLIHPEAFR